MPAVVGLLVLAVWTARASAAQEVTVPSTSVETTTATTAPETTTTSRPPAATTLATPPPTRTATTTRRRATTTTTTTAPTTTIFVIPGRPADEGSPPPTTGPLTPARPPSGDLPRWATALFWVGVGGATAIMAATWARNRRRPTTSG